MKRCKITYEEIERAIKILQGNYHNSISQDRYLIVYMSKKRMFADVMDAKTDNIIKSGIEISHGSITAMIFDTKMLSKKEY